MGEEKPIVCSVGKNSLCLLCDNWSHKVHLILIFCGGKVPDIWFLYKILKNTCFRSGNKLPQSSNLTCSQHSVQLIALAHSRFAIGEPLILLWWWLHDIITWHRLCSSIYGTSWEEFLGINRSGMKHVEPIVCTELDAFFALSLFQGVLTRIFFPLVWIFHISNLKCGGQIEISDWTRFTIVVILQFFENRVLLETAVTKDTNEGMLTYWF